MAAANFTPALQRLLEHEGGYSNHPSDPGGPTKFGITLSDYRKYVMPKATAADVRAMKIEDAQAIYRAKYWGVLRCDDLPAGLDYAVFDYGVNSGPSRAAKVLQRLLRLADDGRITSRVIEAARRRDARELVGLLCDERLAFLQSLKIWPVFGTGWSRRVREVRAASLALASAAPSSRATNKPVIRPTPGKGEVPANTTMQRGTAGGVVAGGGALASRMPDAAVALAVLVAAGLIAVALWQLFHWQRQRRQDAAIPATSIRSRNEN